MDVSFGVRGILSKIRRVKALEARFARYFNDFCRSREDQNKIFLRLRFWYRFERFLDFC